MERSININELPLYCTNLSNIQYITGFSGTSGVCIIKPKKTLLFTDGRYLERAAKEVFAYVTVKNIHKNLKDELRYLKVCYVEPESIKLSEFNRLTKAYPSVRFLQGSSEIEQIRSLKSNEEVKLTKYSAKIAITSLNKVLMNKLRYGMEEIELAFLLAEEMVCNQGAENVSFNPVVAFGEKTSEPHHKTSNVKLKKGDIFWVDFGAKYKGYCSDITRTYFTYSVKREQMKIYNIVLFYLNKFTKLYIDGAKCSEINNKMVEFCNNSNVKDLVRHSFGHGIGLNVHELPTIFQNSENVLKNGMIVSCEPGLYIDGKFGIRIEDMILVNGKNPVILTHELDKNSQVLNPKK